MAVKSQKNKRDSLQIVYVGEERGGKTYHAEHYGINFAKKGGCTIAYNVGRPSDYESYEVIDFISREEQQILSGRLTSSELMYAESRIFFFRYNKKVFHIKQLSSRKFSKKLLKANRILISDESSLFLSLYEYLHSCCLILDDSRAFFRHGISVGLINICSKKNHCGFKTETGTGIDVILMFHNLDRVPDEVIDYTDYLFLFRTVGVASVKVFKQRPALASKIMNVFKELDELPKYSCLAVGLKGKNFMKHKNISI